MATNNTKEELRQLAIENLAASRAEISAEIQGLRAELSPKLVLSRLVERHKGAVVLVAIVAGATSCLMIVRHTRKARMDHHPRLLFAEQSRRRSATGSHILRVLAGSLLPALIKFTVATSLRDFLTRSKPQNEPSVGGSAD